MNRGDRSGRGRKIEAWCDLNDADLVEVFKDAMCGDLAEQRR